MPTCCTAANRTFGSVRGGKRIYYDVCGGSSLQPDNYSEFAFVAGTFRRLELVAIKRPPIEIRPTTSASAMCRDFGVGDGLKFHV